MTASKRFEAVYGRDYMQEIAAKNEAVARAYWQSHNVLLAPLLLIYAMVFCSVVVAADALIQPVLGEAPPALRYAASIVVGGVIAYIVNGFWFDPAWNMIVRQGLNRRRSPGDMRVRFDDAGVTWTSIDCETFLAWSGVEAIALRDAALVLFSTPNAHFVPRDAFGTKADLADVVRREILPRLVTSVRETAEADGDFRDLLKEPARRRATHAASAPFEAADVHAAASGSDQGPMPPAEAVESRPDGISAAEETSGMARMTDAADEVAAADRARAGLVEPTFEPSDHASDPPVPVAPQAVAPVFGRLPGGSSTRVPTLKAVVPRAANPVAISVPELANDFRSHGPFDADIAPNPDPNSDPNADFWSRPEEPAMLAQDFDRHSPDGSFPSHPAVPVFDPHAEAEMPERWSHGDDAPLPSHDRVVRNRGLDDHGHRHSDHYEQDLHDEFGEQALLEQPPFMPQMKPASRSERSNHDGSIGGRFSRGSAQPFAEKAYWPEPVAGWQSMSGGASQSADEASSRSREMRSAEPRHGSVVPEPPPHAGPDMVLQPVRSQTAADLPTLAETDSGRDDLGYWRLSKRKLKPRPRATTG